MFHAIGSIGHHAERICAGQWTTGILRMMRQRIFQVVAGVVLLLAALTPLVECFDHWDGNVVPATDTELRATMLFAVAGLVLAIVQLVRVKPDSPKSGATVCVRSEDERSADCGDFRPEPTSSPPRIPLRI